jgi:hypothetical protein
MHCVFSTKERRPWLASNIRERLWPYLGGIARENNMKALAIGGVTDHVLAFEPAAYAFDFQGDAIIEGQFVKMAASDVSRIVAR